MTSKEKIAKLFFKGVERDIVKMNLAVDLMAKFDPFFSRKMSKGGKFLRGSQVEFIRNAIDKHNKRAWISVLYPAEILHPFGIYPLSLEILSGLLSTCGLADRFLESSLSLGVPNTMCSFHRMMTGLAASKYFDGPDMVCATSLLCDGNLKSFSHAAKSCGVPFLYLDVPYELNQDSVEYLKKQLMASVEKIADITRTPFRMEKFQEVISLAQKGMDGMWKIYEKRSKADQYAFRGHEMANFCFPAHYLLGSEQLIKITDRILKTLSDPNDRHRYFPARKKGFKPKRFMWMHIVPQYETPIWELLDNGVTTRIICEEHTPPYFKKYDASDPFGSVAKRLISHPSNGDLSRRIDNALRIAKDFKVDGVVHYSSWGCHQAAGNVHIIEKAFENEGIRFLNLNGDAVDRSNTTFGQHKTRIEAFLER